MSLLSFFRSRPWVLPLLLAAFTAQAFVSGRLEKWVHPVPYEDSATLQMDKRIASTMRAGALLTGTKVLTGHLFWIGVIQYYGNVDNSVDRFAKLYDYCRLASDLNPQFVSIYTYGGSALAFHLKRVDQAIALLEKGVKANPHADRLKFIQAAILFQNTDKMDLLIPILEEEVRRSDAPPLMINILANSYSKVGRYQEAIRLWKHVLQSNADKERKIEAARRLQDLYAILKQPVKK